jgi:hypothetical protein
MICPIDLPGRAKTLGTGGPPTITSIGVLPTNAASFAGPNLFKSFCNIWGTDGKFARKTLIASMFESIRRDAPEAGALHA